MRSLNQEDAKAITDGAIRSSVIIAEVQDLDAKLLDRSLLNRGDSTYYNRVYVRNYEPELVRRFRKASAQLIESNPASIEASPSRLNINPYNGSSE